MLTQIPKPDIELERNDMPAYTASNGFTFEEFVDNDGFVYERGTKGNDERWYTLGDN